RVGVADDLLTAEHAARRAPVQESMVVAPGGAPAFLRSLPVEALEPVDPSGAAMVSLLKRLGLFTLGDVAALPAAGVEARFGRQVAWVHRVMHAEAGVERALAIREAPPDLTV